MNKLIIFGERPGPNTDPKRPLWPHTTTGAAARLARLLGMTTEEYIAETIRYNVVDNRHTATSFPSCRARVERRILFSLRRYGLRTRVLFLGQAALAGAPAPFRNLSFNKFRYFEPFGHVMVIPHTSGVNRYYNSEGNIRLTEEALRSYAGR